MAASTPDRRWQTIVWDLGPVAILFLVATLTVADEGVKDPPAQYLILLPLLVRQRWPLVVLVGVSVLALATVTQTPTPWIQVGAVGLASFSSGELANDRTRTALVVVIVSSFISLALLAMDADALESIVLPILVLMPAWLLGDIVRTRRLEGVARAAEHERERGEAERRVREAVAEERRTMARELHDVVAHGVSVMLIQAGAARQVLETSPGQANDALLTVEATGREAMAELRRLLGVLNDEGESAGVAPQPGIDQLGTLLERVREAGLPAELEVSGTPQSVPISLDVTVYRIVQEALTNALRYARRAATLVRLTWEPTQLRVEILDDGPTVPAESGDGAGRGLVGMSERAERVGGRLEAGPRLGGGYAVRAWLPLGSDAP
jgi:signal transduction histidine kinase